MQELNLKNKVIEDFLYKYKILISEKLEVKPENIEFLIYNREIGTCQNIQSLEYVKVDTYLPTHFIVRLNISSINLGNKYSEISYFSLIEMPNCCAFVISTQASVSKKYTNKGIGTILNSFRIEIAKLWGYSAIICTDIEKNVNQRKILKKNGWIDVYNVVNKRTKNKVFISVKAL